MTKLTALFSTCLILIGSVLASSPRFDLIDYPAGPVLTPGSAGSFDSQAVLDPELVWDGSKVRLYYTAVDEQNVRRIAVATSSDLVNWEPAGIVLEPRQGEFDSDGVSAPDILFAHGQYHLYYTAETAGWKHIAHVTSADGFDFSNTRTIVLAPSFIDQNFDFIGASDSSTVFSNGLFQMLYRGHDGTPWWKIGLAISTDGTRFNRIFGDAEQASIFGKGPHGFDDGGAEDPEIWAGNDNDLRMLYTSLHY